MYDLIIIGGGPAGITAGIYAARQNLKTLLITKEFGGQVARKSVPVENYPGFPKISGQELIQNFRTHLERFKVKVQKDTAVKIEKINEDFKVFTESKKEYQSKAIIVASGVDPRPLKVPGEREFLGKGVSYCTTCDGPLFKDKTVAVIGGGNAGFEAALFLVSFAKKIYILESGPVVKAFEANQEEARKTGKIEVITDAVLKEIKGDKFVNSLVYQDVKSKEDKIISAEGVFVEIGSFPAVSFVRNLVKFDHLINKLDEIEINPRTCTTTTPGLFAAGDVSDIEYKQIVIAAGEGAKAALSAYKYLQKINRD